MNGGEGMDEKKIARINELYKKKKEGTITEEELKEQASLRMEYVASIRRNLRATLENVSILEADGTVSPLKKKGKA